MLEVILNEIVENKKDEIINSTKELVKIKSVFKESNNSSKPFGEGIHKALDYTLKLGKRLGLKSDNVDGYAGYLEIGEGRGMIGVLCHIDVVPEGPGWDYSPYKAQIYDGKLFGRGALDDKGPTIASIFALKVIRESGLPVSKRARVIIGTDEEIEARGIKYYLKNMEKPLCGFSPDAEFPVIFAEKGILRFRLTKKINNKEKGEIFLIRLTGGNRLNVVPSYAKAEIESSYRGLKRIQKQISYSKTNSKIKITEGIGNKVLIESFGKSAHASLPEEGENAISQIVGFLKNLNFQPDDSNEFIKFLSDKFGDDIYGKNLNINFKDKVSGCLTLNFGLMNINTKEGRAAFDIRYPVLNKKEDIWCRLKKVAIFNNLELEEIQHKPPLYIDSNTKLIKTLQRVYFEATNQEPKLISIGGGTYCRYLENFVAFGPVFPGQKELAHQVNEYISIEDLIKITKIYAQAIYELIK